MRSSWTAGLNLDSIAKTYRKLMSGRSVVLDADCIYIIASVRQLIVTN